jgi:signal transduction histidine kinase
VTFVIAVCANLCSLFGSHYLFKQNNAFSTIPDTLALYPIKKSSNIKNLVNKILQFNFVEFCRSNTPKNEATYLYIGVFSIISVFTSVYALPNKFKLENGLLINCLYNSVLFIAAYFMTYSIWSDSLKKKAFAAVSWLIGTTYLLVWAPCIFVLLSDFAHSQLANFCINIIIVALIFKWKPAISLMSAGIYLALVFFKNFIDPTYVMLDDINANFKITYILLLFGSTIIAFLRPMEENKDQEYIKITTSENEIRELSQEMLGLMIVKQEFVNNIQHEIRTPIHHIGMGANALYKNWHQYNDQEKQNFASLIYKGYTNILGCMNNILDLSNLSINKIDMNYAEVNIIDLVYKTIVNCKKFYIEGEEIEFIVKVETKNKMIECDYGKIEQALSNLLKNSINYSSKGVVEIIIADANLKTTNKLIPGIKVSVVDEGIGIPQEELHSIFGPFSQSSYTKKSSGGKGLGLALAQKIIQMHGGNIWAQNNCDKPGAILSFIVPKQKQVS